MSRTHRSPRPVRAARILERLEPRTLMAVFTVNSFSDILNPSPGTVTLRSAIEAANNTPGTNTIVLPSAGTYRLTSFQQTSDPNSGGALTYIGLGNLTIANTSSGQVTVAGNGINAVFSLAPTDNTKPFAVTFQGLIITGGVVTSAGGRHRGPGGGRGERRGQFLAHHREHVHRQRGRDQYADRQFRLADPQLQPGHLQHLDRGQRWGDRVPRLRQGDDQSVERRWQRRRLRRRRNLPQWGAPLAVVGDEHRGQYCPRGQRGHVRRRRRDRRHRGARRHRSGEHRRGQRLGQRSAAATPTRGTGHR